ncbi:metal-dependent phosphohydrolase [Blastococcus sp. CT_GayMR16]|uniref:HD domain-containing protein n=1 Tax=Blastococcus sp. CT_GayMR16 TaxID=2559607 RepID=UPI0010737123|nr:metal-dependent phosphohydrolase [Blastococcus sp. CT_GayMR16]TFV90623.1 metal-dependent phosphohydrolase [Blastococcus sp. CT_GayMR16]
MTGLVDFDAWAELAGDSPTSRTEWAAVVAAWSEPHRRYHDLAHLAAVLGLIGELAGAADDPAAVRLAAWYHDIAYEPERTDNEQVSAARARVGLRGLVPDGRVDEVERLVLLTAGHDPAPDDANGAVLCDADLAVLAGPPDAYATYASAVREEYGHLSDEEFTAGRIAVLEHLLALPALYRTPEAARQWADRAAANMTAELALLRRRAASGPATPPPAAG